MSSLNRRFLDLTRLRYHSYFSVAPIQYFYKKYKGLKKLKIAYNRKWTPLESSGKISINLCFEVSIELSTCWLRDPFGTLTLYYQGDSHCWDCQQRKTFIKFPIINTKIQRLVIGLWASFLIFLEDDEDVLQVRGHQDLTKDSLSVIRLVPLTSCFLRDLSYICFIKLKSFNL